jgi:hypothetical protein
MKSSAAGLLAILTAFGSGCASPGVNALERRVRITYYDRNGDGKVDLEKHRYPGMADMDSELRDDNHNGRYEKKVIYGVGIFESKIDLPVPAGVRIESKM